MVDADELYREIMTMEPPKASTPFEAATRDFVFGQVWPRPGLTRKERRWVTLTCVAAADSPWPIEDHVYAALNSGDIALEEMLEFILQFAVYCGWPKAAHCEGVIHRQSSRINDERGQTVEPWPMLSNDALGFEEFDKRLFRGAQEFADVNLDARAPTAVAVPPRRDPQLRLRSRVAAPRHHAVTSAGSSPSPRARSTTHRRR